MLLFLCATVAHASDGDLDPSFNAGGSGPDSEIVAMAVQPDGKIIICGGFITYNGDSHRFVMRLNSDGTPDSTFNAGGAGPNSAVGAVAIQADGKILIAGSFTAYNGDEAASDRVMRLNVDGTRDPTFNAGGAGADGNVFALAIQPDGKILIGGFFTGYNGDAAANDRVMRLNTDGTRDATFNAGGSGANSGVFTVAIQPDGKILVGGFLTAYNGDASASDFIMRLNADGTRDMTFNPGGTGANDRVSTIAVQPDGKIMIGGFFFFYNGDAAASDHVMRLNADGTRDVNFNAGGSGTESPVNSVVIQGGKILVGGGFRVWNGDAAASDFIMRLNSDGTRDTTFNPNGEGANSVVDVVALQPDGKILIGGLFTGYNNDTAAPDRIERLLQGATQGVFSLSQPQYIVGESDRALTITVNRLGDISIPASVEYSTSDSGAPCINSNMMASAKCDFTTALGVLDFAAGQTSKTFVVLISQDSYVEGIETFTVGLSNPTGGVLGSPANATVTIVDDLSEPSTNPIDEATNFVRQHYHDFLNREPDQSGLDFWSNQITACGSDAQCLEVRRVNVSAAFFLSIEFQQTGYLVERFYKVAYGDGSGTSTLGGAHSLKVPVVRFNEFLKDTQRIGRDVIVLQPGWEQLLENNKQAYALEFVRTSRFAAALPTSFSPAGFVDTLNANAGNVLSPAERTAVINVFGGAVNSNDNTARAKALRMIAEDQDLYNAEFNRAFVLAQYLGYLRRNPNDAPEPTLDYTGYDFWLTKLNQFNGDYIKAELVKAFISSGEYRQRFGP